MSGLDFLFFFAFFLPRLLWHSHFPSSPSPSRTTTSRHWLVHSSTVADPYPSPILTLSVHHSTHNIIPSPCIFSSHIVHINCGEYGALSSFVLVQFTIQLAKEVLPSSDSVVCVPKSGLYHSRTGRSKRKPG